MGLLAFLLRSSRGIVVLSALAGIVAGAAGVALIALIHAELARDGAADSRVAWAFAGLCVLAAGARVAAQLAMVRLGQGAVTRLCLLLCRKVLALPLERFERNNPAGLVAILTEDIVLVANALVGVPLICINGPIVVACLTYAGWLSPPALACGVAFAAAAIGAYLYLSARAMAHLRSARARQDALVGHFRALIDGFRELKQHRRRREAFLAEALGPAAGEVRDRMAAGLGFFAVAQGWSQAAFFGFIGFLLFVMPSFRGADRAALSGLVLVVLYIMSPLDVILTWLPILGRARASMDKIRKVLPSLEADDAEADSPTDALPFREAIELDRASYAYPPEADGSRFSLGPVDLMLRPGEVVFLAGGNGSGKTTLVKLLSGLYAPTEGAVRVDGREVGPADREAYRQLFSVVFADGYLFRNLLGLDRDGLEKRARHGLDRLGLAGKVRVEGGSYSTTDLSQGQRRRLALLTALLEGRPVCVFDEWAANQDPTFKKAFYLELLPELKAAGKALLVISHDEDYYDAADRVFRLRDGRTCAEGDRDPVAALEANDGGRTEAGLHP
jgi:putative pyoverdin transport system ATP-binding/permease protein